MNGGGHGRAAAPSLGAVGGGSARKRSRTESNASSSAVRHSPPSSGSGGGGRGGRRTFALDKNERLLRLNVGGYPYDVVRTSLPLLETMMTDRWLDSCLLDGDGRIFIDRDGDAFGDVLRYLRGGADFLSELVRSTGGDGGGGGYSCGGAHYGGGGPKSAALRAAGCSAGVVAGYDGRDRLRRLRTEADYYGLHRLVHDIDNLTIGEKIIFEDCGWARVAGGFRPRNVPPNGENDIVQNDNGAGVNAGAGARNNAGDAMMQVDGENGNNRNENQEEEEQEEEEEEEENEQQEDDDLPEDGNEGDEHDNQDEDEAEDDQAFAAAADADDEDDVDPSRPPPYKRWSWSQQYGNPDILRPHPTHTSGMVVGRDGTYLLLLRLAAALPSPLARIKWDQEEEEGRLMRRVTRAALRRSSDPDHGTSGEGFGGAGGRGDDPDADGRSRELEEDYFVIVHVEAPLSAVTDCVDESQTHFPLLRTGLWDYRAEEEVANDDPVFATLCGADVVSLRAGDVLSVGFVNDEVSRERSPFPDAMPPELVNSLTLVRIDGNTMARYERLKASPMLDEEEGEDRARRRGSRGAALSSPTRRASRGIRGGADDRDEEDGPSDASDPLLNDPAAEERGRSLTRSAHWASPPNDFPTTPFRPGLRDRRSVLEFPHPGHYLLLGRVAVGCRRDASFRSVLNGGPVEGHRTQMSVRSAGGRLLHALGFVFEDKPRLEWADLSVLSENAMFNDVVHVPRTGTELSVATTGDCRLHPEGTEVGAFCSAVSQSLSCLLLDDEIMEVDRYMVGTARNPALDRREVKWFHTRSASAPSGQGRGGARAKPSLFDVDGHRLVWRGCLNRGDSGSGSATVLVMGSIPPLHSTYVLGLLKNGESIAISITPESLDMKGRHCHYFQEVVELSDGDEITVAECAYGGEEGDQMSWREQLHVEARFVEFDTRIGHLSFVVLHQSSNLLLERDGESEFDQF
ncbi:hypothetical protein ACHAWF_008419 [Thalassiosira exigua]